MSEPDATAARDDDSIAARDDRTRAIRSLWRVSRLVLAGLLALACAAGGAIALGSVWVSERSNDHWAVQTRLTPRSQIDIPTSVGTATFDTHAWGPGAQVEVSALALPPVGRSGGSPFIDIDAQIEEVKVLSREALMETAWKAATGAVLGGLIGGLLWMAFANRSRSLRRRAGVAVVAAVCGSAVFMGAWGAGAWLTFDEHYGGKLEADGLLAVGLSADRLLAELNSRDQKYAGYVQSLATYIARLSESAGEERQSDVAVRVMLISDVHGRNIYPQLAEVIRSQEIDFVLDSGDLVQWGTGFELSERPDLRAGIESVGVPYLFVKGNHDGVPTVEEIRGVSNVTVLERQRIEIHGLGVLGVPDPRVYQDGGPVEAEDPDGVEEIEVEAARRAAEERPEDSGPIDLAVMHHPSGARELGELLEAPVWVSGHTHSPALDVADVRIDITVGTTGAAGIRTFRGQNEEGEVVPTPQSFDILGFNAACDPISLTRFSYPDVLSDVGNALVTYQTLSLERPEPEPDAEEPERACG